MFYILFKFVDSIRHKPGNEIMVALETGGCVLFTCIQREPLPSCTHAHTLHRLHCLTGEIKTVNVKNVVIMAMN